MSARHLAVACLAWGLTAPSALAYPLDAAERTGITRLEGYRLAQRGEVRGRLLPEGAQLPHARIGLRLMEQPDFTLPVPDAAFSQQISRLLGGDRRHYGVAVLDLTDRQNPRYAEHNAAMLQNPGSVGKVLTGASVLAALAEVYPDDIAARRKVLREAELVADDFIRTDSHTVPFWQAGAPRVTKRPIQIGDRANLWTWMDWMMSSSSNAAAATVQAHALLVAHHKEAYPVSPEQARAHFRDTPRAQLGAELKRLLQGPVTAAGLDLASLRQGSLFTRTGKHKIPGTSSHATARELLRFLVALEQGRVVDPWSSLELKRLLYLTDRRIRYASSPALYDAAVSYKSGSLYSCRPESGFSCKKYHGNVKNYMNSIAIVETPDGERPLLYLVALVSNVLRKNSAVAHQIFATRLHRLIQAAHPIASPPPLPPRQGPATQPESAPPASAMSAPGG